MLYAIFCYDSEEVVGAWSKEKDAAVMENLGAVQTRLLEEKKLGPVARLGPTRRARTVRKQGGTITDGPFAETKEALLGFFVVDCATEEEALQAAKDLGAACGSNGAYEVRPMIYFSPGGPTSGELGG